MAENHLVVLVHGLWGSASNLKRLSTVLESVVEKEEGVKLHTFAPTTFSQFKTYDGIEHIGDYVIQSLFKELERLHSEDVRVDKISFIGYSLGGLISRYVIGELYGVGFFDLIAPVLFATFATPHLGTTFFSTYGFHAPVMNFLGTNFLGQTGKDLFLQEGKNGILYRMSLKEGKYFKSLTKFKKLISFANIRYDRTVAFYTAYMTEYDAFKDWEHVSFETVEGLPTAHVLSAEDSKLQNIETRIVDFANSGRVENGPVINGLYSPKTNGVLLVAMTFMTFLFPVVFSVSVFASIKSFIRVNVLPEYDVVKEWNVVKLVLQDKYELSTSVSQDKESEDGLLEHAKQDIADTTREYVEDGLNMVTSHTEDEELLKEDTNENIGEDEHDTTYNIDCEFRVHCENENKAIDLFLNNSKFKINDSNIIKGLKPLPFNQVQKEIHDNLNELNWVKVAAYLPSLNAHQTIVARRSFSTTSQGIPLMFLFGFYAKQLFKDSSS